jgi:protein-L-isoaspartate(D-aspartate) O-methyltransferase
MTSQHPRERLIKQLQTRGIRNKAVLEAIRATPRHLFVDKTWSHHAYSDHPLPIGQGQTISQPYIVARMTEELLNQGRRLEKVLEIGTGCGYQTAILAQLVGKVYTVERIQSLSLQAREHLSSLGLNNIQFSYGDGQWGWAEYAPYPGIIVTAAPTSIPEPLLTQLTLGGCLIIPVGPPQGGQELLKVIRTRTSYEQYLLDEVSFVPLCKGVS